MEITARFDIEGPLLIKPRVFTDSRGYFLETYNEATFRKLGLNINFLQDNLSSSAKNVVRGLHFQAPPFDQGKLVRVVKGSVLDVIVDIRRNSSTYGQSLSVKLDALSHEMLWIPSGFAHGFLSLEEETIFMYKCTNIYHKDSESGILWNDPDLNINWGTRDPVVSEKDLELSSFATFNSPF